MQYRHRSYAVFILLALTGLALLSLYLLQPPASKPANAPVDEFSAERAMRHVVEIAEEPHAMGTAAHAEVRTYLLEQMQELGLNPQVQETTAANEYAVGYVYNLLGRLEGRGNTGKSILVMAHYDSQPNARGAGDDGAGVAAILETVRALKQTKRLEHDLIVLFTDGEEYGLYGAKAFLKHPWAKDVELVLNLEGRGSQGPSMTFELSPENGWVAEQYIEHAPYPFLSSLAYEIYKRMPNDTDFTVFKNAGYSGLNSAFIDGFVHYHKATDSPENLSLNTVQQHGSNLLALLQHFGNTSLEKTKAPDIVFFNAINGWVISYPQWMSIFWVVLAALLLIAVFVLGVRKGAFTIAQSLISFVVFLVLLIIVAGISVPVNSLVLDLLPLTHRMNGVYSANGFFVAYLLLALGLFLLLSWLALRWLQLLAMVMGVFILQFILVAALYLTIPSATYLLVFPLLFSLVGLLVILAKDLHEVPEINLTVVVILVLAAIPAIFILMPIVHVVFVAFSLQLPIGSLALFVLLLGFLLPLLHLVEHSFRWRRWPLLPLLLLLAGTVVLILALQNEKPSAKQPLHSHVSYYVDTDSSKAYWASYYQNTDDWNRQFFQNAKQEPLKEIYPHASLNYLKSEAETFPVAAPVAAVVTDSVTGGERLLRLRLASQRGAAHMEIVLKPENPEDIKSIKLAGEALQLTPVDAQGGKVYYALMHGLPQSKEVQLEVRLEENAPLTLYLYDQSIGLPEQLVKEPKPAHVIAEQGRNSNLTVMRKSYTF
ncbi:M20/M25/M40 family metallo-hydrolase [Pontibacter cellulosilyticus]|uniref:Vacuolar membrane protease n=1 Tax=Pontibacter cellulosilyticus TaxID=1720253 RepID=A0A923N5U7_9BACT|nr:M20/M25/M40 family metallo-hydrolase [Pontibacter cellulosilyticus]MBC5992763.1 M20/M25/M40 family metallo-hydrolase [Pontibacter cellulosilyticus]